MQAGSHLRVALTTNSLVHVDAGFADARQVVFYNVTREGATFVDVMPFGGALRKPPETKLGDTRPGAVKPGFGKNGGACMMAEDLASDAASGDLLSTRVQVLAGCSILITRGLSDLAAVRLQEVDVFPVKTERAHEIDSVLDRLQLMLNGRPALWLRRVLRDAHGQLVPLEEQGI
jgi:nitrogen fixation protein NifX